MWTLLDVARRIGITSLTDIENFPDSPGAYSYDNNGNRRTKAEGAVSVTYTYNTAISNRLLAASSSTAGENAGNFYYDANGNLTSVDDPAFFLQGPGKGVVAPSLTYSVRDRYAGFFNGSSLGVVYGYNGDGVRFHKEIDFIPQGRHTIPIQFFTAEGKLIEEFNPSGAVSGSEHYRDYLWARSGNENLAQISTQQTTNIDTLYFTHGDHLGTPIAMTSASGALVWRVEHRPFGGIFSQSAATITNNLRFPGQYYDFESGLAQNGFRDYSAKLGRYIEPDPIGLILGNEQLITQPSPTYLPLANVYTYSMNNTLLFSDPLGLCIVGKGMKRCLQQIFNKSIDSIKFDMAGPSEKWDATTRVNLIRLYISCDEFFSSPSEVLEEYYHVLEQWNTGRLTILGYVDEYLLNGYRCNKYEREAKKYAREHTQELKDCLGCTVP